MGRILRFEDRLNMYVQVNLDLNFDQNSDTISRNLSRDLIAGLTCDAIRLRPSTYPYRRKMNPYEIFIIKTLCLAKSPSEICWEATCEVQYCYFQYVFFFLPHSMFTTDLILSIWESAKEAMILNVPWRKNLVPNTSFHF